MAVFLLAGLVSTSIVGAFAHPSGSPKKGIWGGLAPQPYASELALLALVRSEPKIAMPTPYEGEGERNATPPQSLFIAALDDFGTAPGFPAQTGIVAYKVGRGDTIAKIARKFSVSTDTVLRANPGTNAKRLSTGAVLQIPQVSGTVYAVKEGDTIGSIAAVFNVSPTQIQEVNGAITVSAVKPGVHLVIPGVSESPDAGNPTKKLPVLRGYFVMPVQGVNGGRVHPVNAVDIAGVCGTTVVAAAEGLVVPDDQYGEGRDGWNGGYGKFVLIEHPAGPGVQTRYAHLHDVAVEVGDYVKQGQKIGTMGRTGDASGCHVHFEVHGAANPFAQ